jgi:hypothetical protein
MSPGDQATVLVAEARDLLERASPPRCSGSKLITFGDRAVDGV